MGQIKETLFELKKRTYQMFLGQVEDELGINNSSNPVQDEVVKAKFEHKYTSQYQDRGKILPPGILVEENKRRKILQELGGGELRTSATQKID